MSKKRPRKPCKHCKQVRSIYARRLCEACWRDQKIRALYPLPRKRETETAAQAGIRLCAYCGAQITDPGRRRFCCDGCSRAYYREQEVETRSTVPPANIVKLQKRTRKRRTCLRCGKRFMSDGAWNRICPKCGEKDDGGRPAEAKGEYHWQDTF